MTEKRSSSDRSKHDDGQGAELMYVKCAVCGNWMDVKPGHINQISHSFCPECYKKEMQKLNRGA